MQKTVSLQYLEFPQVIVPFMVNRSALGMAVLPGFIWSYIAQEAAATCRSDSRVKTALYFFPIFSYIAGRKAIRIA